jgi:ADP-ribose pyrophosphatase YjhB (NUDIX family)
VLIVSTDADTWLAWSRELHAIAQAGLTYAENGYDHQRYARLREIAADLTAALSDAPPAAVRMAVLSESGYLTPKIDVRAAVHDDTGRVLMVREVVDGRWTLPGGWADVNEGLVEGACREVREESGYLVEGVRLLGIYDKCRWGAPPHPLFTLTAVVACRLVGGEATTSYETDGVDWVARGAVPPLSEGRTPPALLARVFEHHDDPSLPQDLI